jgi:gluconokinase
MTMRKAIVVMGVSGSGKSSVGAALAASLAIPFVDADSLHAPESIARMAAGLPLTDDDRWPWLSRVGAHLADTVTYPGGIVIACSSLKRAYRDRIRAGAGRAVAFVFLDIQPETVRARLAMRKDHFMPASLIESQFATLENPSAEEKDVLRLAVTRSVEEIAGLARIAFCKRGADEGTGQETSR